MQSVNENPEIFIYATKANLKNLKRWNEELEKI